MRMMTHEMTIPRHTSMYQSATCSARCDERLGRARGLNDRRIVHERCRVRLSCEGACSCAPCLLNGTYRRLRCSCDGVLDETRAARCAWRIGRACSCGRRERRNGRSGSGSRCGRRTRRNGRCVGIGSDRHLECRAELLIRDGGDDSAERCEGITNHDSFSLSLNLRVELSYL